MTLRREEWTRVVAGALEAYAVAVVQMAPGHWTFAPRGSRQPVSARLIDDEWLVLDAELPADVARQLRHGWDVFTANAALAGGLKLCAGGAGGLQLRAELPLDEEISVESWVQQLCASIAAAVLFLETPKGACAPSVPALEADAVAGVDLERLCADAQWPFTVRAPHIVMVELDVPGTFQQATAELQPQGGVLAWLPILPAPPATPVCAAAAARFLLIATAAIRMVRAAVRPPATAVRLEVGFAQCPTAPQLAHAFAALSVAWRTTGRETEVLAGDTDIAQLYLLESAKHRGAELRIPRVVAWRDESGEAWPRHSKHLE